MSCEGEKRRLFEVTGYMPGIPPSDVPRFVGAYVIATTAVRAAMLVVEKYPGVRLGAIHHKALLELIEDPHHAREEETKS